MSNKIPINTERITGTGLVFPIKLENGRAQLSTGWELIKASLKNILSYEYGERYFLYEFGLKLRALLEDPVDEATISILEYQFEVNLPNWERRCKIDSIEIIPTKDLGKVNISCRVTILATQQEETFVFPYYKEIIY